ncbi:MAG: sugar phosphate isomerase/epimerase [Armatimonadetes bacterium]|nr:sugar phosphate isomerase/epimerase [Armatimonadota bacterium]
MPRRTFLSRSAGLAGAALAGGALAPLAHAKPGDKTPASGPFVVKKAVVLGMLPGSMPLADRFKLCRDCGFDGVEASPEPDLKKAEQMRAWADQAGIEIHSIMFGGWHAPLSHPNPEVAQRGEDELKTCMRSAKAMGATSVLLVPAVVNADTRYVDAYTRSQRRIRNVIPVAAEVKVPILVEEVWNKFLLSPLEFAKYIDEFRSPWVQAYFDVGNVVDFAWPEDWILTLGKRIKRVHLKDFKRGPRQFVNLGEGDVDWPKVRQALRTVGYSGWYTAELSGGDEAYLKDVAARIDRLIKG